MRRLTPGIALAAFLLISSPSPADAQSQWRITPFAGGSVVGELQNSNDGKTVEFDNGFAVGLSTMWRKGHIGVEVQGHLVPTEATVVSGFVRSQAGDATDPDATDPVFVAEQVDLNLMFGSLNLAYFSGNAWGPDSPFVPREWYVIGGAGLVRFGNEHPLRDTTPPNVQDPDVGGWESGTVEKMFNIGVGLQFNVLGSLSIQFELRDYIFEAIERNQSLQVKPDPAVQKTWHNNFVLRQGVTFVLF